jgi:hypothetical protein
VAFSAGCVERQLTIRSNPPGALVYVDGYDIGVTPISTPFIYYGDRKIQLVKDGYETLTVLQPLRPPWYEVPPLDFVSENLTPGKLRDQRTLDFQMQPQAVVPTGQLLGRAEALRRGAGVAPPGPAFVPAPAAGPPVVAPVGPVPPGEVLPAPAPSTGPMGTPPPGGQPLNAWPPARP